MTQPDFDNIQVQIENPVKSGFWLAAGATLFSVAVILTSGLTSMALNSVGMMNELYQVNKLWRTSLPEEVQDLPKD